MRYRPLIVFLALAAATLAVYYPAFNAPFIFDDGMYIIKNPVVAELKNFWPPSGPRYLGYLSFALNYRFGGLDPFGYHFANVAVHIANVFLVYLLVELTFKTPLFERAKGREAGFGAAMIAAVFFAVHPVETQAVTYITQRFASLATLFYLLTLVLYALSRLKKGAVAAVLYLVAFASAVAAQATKEIAFTLPAVMALYEFAFLEGDVKKRALRLIPFMLTMAIVPLTIFGPECGLGAGTGLSERTRELQVRDLTVMPRYDYLVTQFRVIVTYLRILALPAGQNIDYDYPLFHSIFTPEVLLSFLFLLIIFAAAAYLFLRSIRSGNAPGVLAAFGVFWFFITLSIESSVIPINDLVFEHRVYLPSIGLFIALGAAALYALARLKGAKAIKVSLAAAAIIVAALLAVPYGGAAYMRNTVWQDELAFWEDTAGKSPGKARVHNNLGGVYYKRGMAEKAIAAFSAAIRLKPDFADAHYNLGIALKDAGAMDEAISSFEAAVRHQPSKANAHNNLGLAYYMKGRTDEAIEEFKTSLSLDPANLRAYNNLGLAYMRLGRLDEAEREFESALALNPGFEDAYNNLQSIYRRQGLP